MRSIIFLYKMLEASLIEKFDIRNIHTKYPSHSYKRIEKACREIVRYYVDPSHVTLIRVFYEHPDYSVMFDDIVEAMK